MNILNKHKLKTERMHIIAARRRFIAILVLLLLVVFSCILIGSGIYMHQRITMSADSIIAAIDRNDGELPAYAHEQLAENGLPEYSLEARYFSVKYPFAATEPVFYIDDKSITEQDAFEMSQKVLLEHSIGDRGYEGDYRFYIASRSYGAMMIFLNRETQLDQFQNQLLSTLYIEGLIMILIAVVAVFWSRIVVKPIEESYRKQNLFIADAGHDIKTPISVIAADAELLSYDIGTDNEWLNDIVNQTEKMSYLVDDLMFLTRMQEENGMNFVEINLSGIVESEVGSYKSLSQSNGKKIISNIAPDIHVEGDEKRLRRLVSILCDNAIKYSSDSSEIKISLHELRRNVILSVENDAEGLRDSDTSRWFDRFYREDESRNKGEIHGGYGIGLSLAAAVVEGHHGAIKALISDNGQSVTIEAIIPINQRNISEQRWRR